MTSTSTSIKVCSTTWSLKIRLIRTDCGKCFLSRRSCLRSLRSTSSMSISTTSWVSNRCLKISRQTLSSCSTSQTSILKLKGRIVPIFSTVWTPFTPYTLKKWLIMQTGNDTPQKGKLSKHKLSKCRFDGKRSLKPCHSVQVSSHDIIETNRVEI